MDDLVRISKVVILLLAVFPLSGQLPIQVACGTTPTELYLVNPATSFAYPTATAPNPNLPAAFPTLRWCSTGVPCHYRIPVQPGVYILFLDFVEPTKTGPGQRSQFVTIQGQQSLPMDIFALAGGEFINYRAPFLAVAEVGVIDIQITATLGNAIISGIEIAGAPLTAGLPVTPAGAAELTAMRATLAGVMTPFGPAIPASPAAAANRRLP